MKKINAVNKTVLLISDIHLPYAHPDYLKFLKAVKKKYSPQIIINTGDEVDNHAISFHDSDSSLFNADLELEKAIEGLQDLKALFPKMDLCESNHGSLVYRRLKTCGIPIRTLLPLQQLYNVTEWNWHEEILLKTKHPLDTYICHGKSSLYNKLAKEQGCNAIQGHFHGKFEITWAKSTTIERYNMFVGCLIDYKSRAFAYGKNHMPKPILGVGYIDKLGMPYLIKMNLDDKGNWNGKV